MARYIPKRDETLEGDPHQKWLERQSLEHDKQIALLQAGLDRLTRANATGGKQTAVVNSSINKDHSETPGFTPFTFTWEGQLDIYDAAMEGASRPHNYSGRDLSIVSVFAYIDTPAVGADFVIDVNLNDSSVLVSAITIPAGENSAFGDIAVRAWPVGGNLSVDIDQVGTTTPGSDLTLTVWAH